MVERLRVAFGTGILLGLWGGKQEVPPSTAHILLDGGGRCSANCLFCPKARGSRGDPSRVSRVVWPEWRADEVMERLAESGFRRICVQTAKYGNSFEDAVLVVRKLSDVCDIPISVCTHPLGADKIGMIEEAGAERMCIPLDCSTPELFARIKGPGYTWEEHVRALVDSRAIFGRATTHLMVGLGESEMETAMTIQQMYDLGIEVGLFAFFPVEGTQLWGRPQPDVGKYRRIQVIRYLISCGMARAEDMEFRNGITVHFGIGKEELEEVVDTGGPFLTSGCPDCNRPFFNESPRGPIYNYPRPPLPREIEGIKRELWT